MITRFSSFEMGEGESMKVMEQRLTNEVELRIGPLCLYMSPDDLIRLGGVIELTIRQRGWFSRLLNRCPKAQRKGDKNGW